MDFIYEEKYKYLTSAMLNVTDDCNLQCRYCFVEQNPHYMSLETAKKAADWLYYNYQKKIEHGFLQIDPNFKCQLYFFGGEPMLCYESIMVPIVQYCNEKYPNIFHFGMTTNGTLLNEKRIKFLKENNFSLLLSMDGNQKIQDYNRPCKNNKLSSFELVEKNIPILLKYFPNITFRATVYAPSVENLFESYLYAESKGFKSFQIMEDNRHEWTKQQIEILKKEFSKIYSYRLQQIINGITPIDFPRLITWLKIAAKLYGENKDTYDPKFVDTIFRCGLATTNGAIGYDGSIYGCQEQVSHGDKTKFLIGNIFNNGIDVKKHEELLKTYYLSQHEQSIKKEQCYTCRLNQFCKDNFLGCPSTMMDLFNKMNATTEIACVVRECYLINSFLFLSLAFSLDNKNINEYLDATLKYVRHRRIEG